MQVGGLNIKQAVSTSLIVIAMSSASGLASHLARGESVPLALAGALTVAALLGMTVGMLTSGRIGNRQLQRSFAMFVAAVGSVLILVNTPAALRLLA